MWPLPLNVFGCWSIVGHADVINGVPQRIRIDLQAIVLDGGSAAALAQICSSRERETS